MEDSLSVKSSSKFDSHVNFESEVEEVLAELNLKTDSLDNAEFDVVAYINEMFPTEQSLANIYDVISDTEKKIGELECETRDVIRGRWESEEEGQEVVQEAVLMIKTLFTRIHDVQDRATRSEEMVHDITKEIQQLDQAKRNLTVSITTLNNLIIIVNALDRLNELLHINSLQTGDTAGSEIRSGESKKVGASNNPFGESDSDKPSEVEVKPDKFTVPGIMELTDLVGQTQRLMQAMLSAYGSVHSVSSLSRELDAIHNVLAERLTRELKIMLAGSRAASDTATLIQAMCHLIDLLPKALHVKPNLLAWFIDRQLGEYRELFDSTQTTAWLDKIDHRYAWLRSNLPAMERRFHSLFPSNWHVTEELIVEFCRLTKIDLETVMKRRQAEMTHNLLIFALQRTLAFEVSLNKIYPDYTPSPDNGMQDIRKQSSSAVKPTKSSNPFDDEEKEPSGGKSAPTEEPNACEKTDKDEDDTGWKKQTFDGLISGCFDTQFELYLNHVEKALRDQLHNRLIGDMTVNKSSLTNREFKDVFSSDSKDANPTPGTSESGENTLYSATDLFLLYKQIIKQTLQLSRGHGLLGLVRLLRQSLSEYAMCVLLAQIPGISLGSPASAGVGGTGLFTPEMTAKMTAFGLSGLSALGIGRGQASNSQTEWNRSRTNVVNADQSGVSVSQLFASLLRDDQQLPRLTSDDVHKVCVILVTSAFCLKTIEELEKRLKLDVRPPTWSGKIAFAPELEAFGACRSVCVHRLVSDLEAAAEPQLAAMARLPWNNLLQVGDQSVYVTEIVKNLRSQVPLIRETLHTVRATFTQICIKFAGALITRFLASLYRCKPVNTFGAEQLLLDTQCLKSALIQMPVFGSRFSQVPPRSFTNLVHEGMGRAERIIKAVMLPVGSASMPSTSGNESGSTPSTAQPSTTSLATTGFVMGPIDAHAAEVFLTSFRQLLRDATGTDLQKILDMKGVKAVEQQLILDTFRSKVEPEATDPINNSTNSNFAPESTGPSTTTTTTNAVSGTSNMISPRPEPVAQTSRIRPFDKLVKKRN